jgi:hypothetical protein
MAVPKLKDPKNTKLDSAPTTSILDHPNVDLLVMDFALLLLNCNK